MNPSPIFSIVLISATLLPFQIPMVQGWSIGDSFHYQPLFDEGPNSCNQPEAANCDVQSIQDECSKQLSLSSLSTFGLNATKLQTPPASLDLATACCATWTLMDCVLGKVCSKCGTKALETIKNDQMIPVWARLTPSKCKDHQYGSYGCTDKVEYFTVIGAIFVVGGLVIASGIFLFHVIRRNRTPQKPMYKLFK